MLFLFFVVFMIMKKFGLLAVLPLVLLVAGCGSNKIDITDTDIDVAQCDQYFELMECILENDTDASYTEEMRDELRANIKSMQEEWSTLDDEELADTCSTELAKYVKIEDRLEEIWCSIK